METRKTVPILLFSLFAAPVLGQTADLFSSQGPNNSTVAVAKMYWADRTAGTILRANLDGTNIQTLVTGLSSPLHVAIDAGAGKMYWTSFALRKIQRANLDGTVVEDVLSGLPDAPVALDLDVAVGKMYWTQGTVSVRRANLDGTSVQTLISGLNFVTGIALDAAAGKMYFLNQNASVRTEVRRANLDGTVPEILVTMPTITGGGRIALDPAAGKMYWVDQVADSIRRANMADGSVLELLLTLTPPSTPTGIALDPTAGLLYWTDSDQNQIGRANLDGTSPVNLIPGQPDPGGIALDLVSGFLCGNGTCDAVEDNCSCPFDCSGSGPETATATCTDGLDNDCDGFADCLDPGCAGVVCRASAGICDSTETCDGLSAACPVDSFQPSTTECRAAPDACDVPEFCTGSSGTCPIDSFQPSTTECRAAPGACDVPEFCTGVSGACPIDGFQLPGTECRASAGFCDLAESCTGLVANCPPDSFLPIGAPCDDGDACTVGDMCTGTAACAGNPDCGSSNCCLSPLCFPIPSEAICCSDGFDNDGDGLTDCADPDCTADPCSICNGPFLVDKKTASDPNLPCTGFLGQQREGFGEHVAIKGNRAVVTAFSSSKCLGQNDFGVCSGGFCAGGATVGCPCLSDDACLGPVVACVPPPLGSSIDSVNTGSADVLALSGSAWVFQHRIELPRQCDWQTASQFGKNFVAISGDRVMTAAGDFNLYFFDGPTLVTAVRTAPFQPALGFQSGSISGDLAVAGRPATGEATVYRRTPVPGGWVEEAVLLPSAFPIPAGGFGNSVAAVSLPGSELIVVGSTNGFGSGYASIFRREVAGWVPEQAIGLLSGVSGNAVAISSTASGTRIAVGAPFASCTGPIFNCGAVHIFRREGTTWVQEAVLTAPSADWATNSRFGDAVSIDGDRVVVGKDSGLAYVFRRDDNGTSADATDDFWIPVARFAAPPGDGFPGDLFGLDVSISGDQVLVGGRNIGPHCGTGAIAAGAAYFFDVTGEDCNGNGIPDGCDIAECGVSVPFSPSCADCNGNGILDTCEIAAGGSADCNLNGVPDRCEITAGSPAVGGPFFCTGSVACDPDCNFNGIPDICDDPVDGIPDACLTTTGGGSLAAIPPDTNLTLADVVAAGSKPAEALLATYILDADQRVLSLVQKANTVLEAKANLSFKRVVGSTEASPYILEGVLLVDEAFSIGKPNELALQKSPTAFIVAPGGMYQKNPLAVATTVTAELFIDNAIVKPGGFATLTSGGIMALTDGMSLIASGNVTLEGALAFSAGAGSAAASLGFTPPPKFRLSRQVAAGGASASTAGLVLPKAQIAGNFRMTNAVESFNNSALGVSVSKDFINEATFPSIFDWTEGRLVMTAVPVIAGDAASAPASLVDGTPTAPAAPQAIQRFEVGGLDLGPTREGFRTLLPTLFDPSPHTNFAIQKLQVGGTLVSAGGAVAGANAITNVVFENKFANTAGAGPCLEAQYIDELTLEAGAQLTLDNVHIYYNRLRDNGATITKIGCGDVVSICAANPPTPPQADVIADAFGVLVPSAKSRFLSFFGGDPGLSQAVRVTFVTLPGAFSVFDGTVAWVDLPQPTSELPGKKLADPIGAEATFLAATLRPTPVFADWSAFGTVHVYDDRIIPSRQLTAQPLEPAVYEIQLVTNGCDLNIASSFSPALQITNARWADIAQLLGGDFRAPDGTVAVDDTLALLAKFGGAANAPIKARVELLGAGGAGPVAAIDGVISVSDLLEVLSAFGGGSYPFTP